MGLPCTRCDSSGFLNVDQVPAAVREWAEWLNFVEVTLIWIELFENHDVQVCDCCGDGEDWYHEPGDHDSTQFGDEGPYAYNGGLPECY
jgi:hypothetical protein